MNGESRRIVLHDVQGFGDRFLLLDGVDQDGKVWVHHRLSGDHICSFCGDTVKEGWVSFQTGSAVCTSHVTISGKVK